jgi:general secretion pathway protein C
MASKRKSKKSVSKIPSEKAERIIAISLQHPELGARRLIPLLKKKRIAVSAATIQRILRRQGLQSRQKRLAKLERRSEKARKPKSPPKKPTSKITVDIDERICAISLQNPKLGAKGLALLLKEKGISATSSVVYRILKRRGLHNREKRTAKAEASSAAPVFIPKTFPEKIPPEVEGRIVDLSLQNLDFGARRLIPLLQQEGIEVSASAVYKILKRNNIENRQKRLLKVQDLATTEPSPAPGNEVPETFSAPAVAISIPPEDQTAALSDMQKPSAAPATESERPLLRKAPPKPTKKRSHWIFYPLYLLLFALIGYLGLHAFQAIQYARLETETVTTTEPATFGITANILNSAFERPLDGYRKIWERNLFNIARTADSESLEKISLDRIVLAKKDLGLELVGTVVADNPQWSRAIIGNRKTREQEAYRVGDKAGEVRIKKILRNNVVITTAEGDELLTVEIKESSKGFASYTGAQQVGSQPASAPEVSGVRPAAARSLSLNLKRDEVAAAFADMDGFMKELRIVPYKSGDQPSGFMIGSITPQNVLRKMGLRSRDVITAINDEAVTGPEQAADFFERLSRGGEVTINFQRRRRDRQIRLNIQ